MCDSADAHRNTAERVQGDSLDTHLGLVLGVLLKWISTPVVEGRIALFGDHALISSECEVRNKDFGQNNPKE